MSPFSDENDRVDESIKNYLKLKEIRYIDTNLVLLKDNSVKTREEVFHLVQPVIEYFLKEQNFHKNFQLEDSVSYALACIFVSESSNSKGQSARSSLWLEHNNPFGLTSSQGVTKKSWEEIKGKRVVMNRTFRDYDRFEDTIESLMWDYLYKPRYKKVRQSSTVKEFLYNLYKCNYMTDSHWHNFAYNQIYLKSMNYDE